jgi:Tfp pilus assembly protein PilF
MILMWKKRAILLALTLLLVLSVYLPARNFPFMFDSAGNILGNPDVHAKSLGIRELYKAAASDLDGRGRLRPIPYITFAVNYYFSGTDPAPYRLVNILIHFLNMFLVYCLLYHLIRGRVDKKYLYYLIGFFALFWGLHPTASQSVTYIVQRMASIMATFYLATILFYILGRERGNRTCFILSGVSFLFACLSKENAVILPVIIWLIELHFFSKDAKRFIKKSVPYIIGAALLITAAYLINFSEINRFFSESYARWEFTMYERVITEFRVVIYYLTLLFFPYHKRLTIEHYFTPSTSLISPITTLASLLFIIALISFAVSRFKKDRLLSFGILFYFANLAIESSIIALDLAFEHRLYIPSMGLLFVLAAIFIRIKHLLEKKVIARTAIAFGAALVLLLSYNTYKRNMVYSDEVTFLSDAIKKAPKRAWLYNNLANVFKRRGQPGEAEKNYMMALEANPDYGEAYNNLGNLYRKQKKYSDAYNNYKRAVELKPDSQYVLNNYATSLMDFKRYEEAVTQFKKAITLKPCYKKAIMNLSKAYEETGDTENLKATLKSAISCDESYFTAYLRLADILIREEKSAEAARLLNEFIAKNPEAESAKEASSLVNALQTGR